MEFNFKPKNGADGKADGDDVDSDNSSGADGKHGNNGDFGNKGRSKSLENVGIHGNNGRPGGDVLSKDGDAQSTTTAVDGDESEKNAPGETDKLKKGKKHGGKKHDGNDDEHGKDKGSGPGEGGKGLIYVFFWGFHSLL